MEITFFDLVTFTLDLILTIELALDFIKVNLPTNFQVPMSNGWAVRVHRQTDAEHATSPKSSLDRGQVNLENCMGTQNYMPTS